MRIFILLALFAALCASCSGGMTTGAVTDEAQRFSLTVLPESYSLGGSAETTLSTRPEAGGLAVDVVASAADLKAFYFDLDYDESQWHPVSVEQNLDAVDESLEIAVTSDPGTVSAGQVLTYPDAVAGFSGELTLATVHFAPGAALGVRSASNVPTKDGSKPVLAIDAAGVLSWSYANIGDYDQNREVNAADLTPIAVKFHQTTGTGDPFDYATATSVIDGDSNGEINIADITPIAANFHNLVNTYAVYRSQDPADYPTTNGEAPKLAPIDSVPFEDGAGTPTQVRLTFTFDASAVGGDDPANIFWVRPVDLDGNNGSPSNQVNPLAPANVAPVISDFVSDTDPVASGADANLTVTASDADGDTLAYSYATTLGTVDATGTSTTVFHAPTVAVPTDVTITVTVDDGQGHTPTKTLTVTVNPEPVSEVHISFTPVAEGGTGSQADAYGLLGDSNYTFTATDQNGTDITSQVTFDYINEPAAGGFPQGIFAGNVFTTNTIGNGTFSIVGTYHQGQPDEVASNPDLAGEEMYFTIVFTLP